MVKGKVPLKHKYPLPEDTKLVCIRCDENKATHLEYVKGTHYLEGAVCDDCAITLCVKCKMNKSTHLEDVDGYDKEMPVCDDCFVVKFTPGFSIEWENEIGMSKKDRRICLLGARMAVEKKKYKWGKADITGVLITITDLDEEQVKFNIDFRVQQVVKEEP